MGFVAQAGHFGLKTQTAKGTFLSPGAVAPNQGVFIFFRSGALGGNRELLIPDPEIGGARDIPDAQLGPISYSGEIDMYARMESLAFFLRSALGQDVVSGTASTGFTHTITPTDTIPWLSVEEKISATYEVFKYTDVKVNTFHMEADANGYLMATAGMVGLNQALTTATPTGTQRRDSSPLIVGSNVCVRWNGVDLPAKSFNMDINNNLEDDDYRLCSLTLGDAVEKRREITMGVTIRPNDSALWKTAMWGGPTATTPLGSSFKDDVQVVISSYEDIPGATVGIKYNCTITIPVAIIAPFSIDPSGDDVIEHDIEIRAVRPVAATPIITAAVLNSYATLP
jgi:hypothetical protein